MSLPARAAARRLVVAQRVVLLTATVTARLSRNASSTTTQATSPSNGAPSPIVRKPLFDKILIANRGEIACRIVRTARKLGVKTVAVYSEADRNSMHVQMADEAFCIGPAPSADSYLRMDKIIEVAKQTGAQAIHPGYGFLSENAGFAEKVTNAGLTFIGPPVQAIVDMGSKSASKIIMENAKVPCVPGYHGTDQAPEKLKTEAKRIGYPVLIKAIKGGGGKGMRIVDKEEDFQEMLDSAKRESMKSFGDDAVLVEKYLVRPRHVEVQVFADTQGNAVYLFERDCSVQRRHQKVLEEAPAPGLTPELRRSLGEKAVAAAKAVNYVGAGTVEFILDTDDQKFYFMEMNTRLQVEHPVTEMVTNTDLVEWQLEVAAGNLLPKFQEDLELVGHAFEARIYAENPNKGFLPDTGRLTFMKTPEESERLRVETGVRMGDEVSVHYDPMISKLVVSGRNRDEALKSLRTALEQFHVSGLHTNIDFLKSLATHPSFIAADVETGFIPKHEKDLFPVAAATPHDILAHAALGSLLQQDIKKLAVSPALAPPAIAPFADPWGALTGLRLNHELTRVVKLIDAQGKDVTVHITEVKSGASGKVFDLTVVDSNGEKRDFKNVQILENSSRDASSSASSASKDTPTIQHLRLELESKTQTPTVLIHTPSTIHIHTPTNGKHTVTLPPTAAELAAAGAAGGAGGSASALIKAPMPCKISQLNVKKGDSVKKGQVVVVLEAMKMEHVVRAAMDGVVGRVHVSVGDVVPEASVLVRFEEKEEKKE
ncbi:carbamoyl-phosphate synthase L chain, ATP binding domain-containing protein [Fimicolochytrium jonesii]|uniref:carbamoyl-phosphate synthase L chain, ATP binding domain-containing protein n=1 Tax=Fimicolochytrium jonesii TaxID=1396493 RepID=UPI0022FDD4E6|nr:carbamoyl-phosphate synthase L chain, ATP binding domain-containing protein [Fimicolochytrium jonesii]KAI8827234.1 carbamoyl-phosphate synthase L chain, ATP binding domain-containing protein [Fimicolochytrium jonesii]